jgi:hypothetical protein
MFLISDITCEDFRKTLPKAVEFYTQMFIISFAITFVLNTFIERKIDKTNYINRVIKLGLLQVAIFVLTFIVNCYFLYNRICK